MTGLLLKISTYLFVLIAVVTCYAPGGGYSFTRFSGPVSGPEKKVSVHSNKYEEEDDSGSSGGGGKYYQNHHKHSVDYVAKPDYHFAYGVEDPHNKLAHGHQESRHGDEVRGEYSVLDPDGVFRTVKYTADKHNGFQAKIITNGQDNSVSYHPAIKPVHENHDDGGHITIGSNRGSQMGGRGGGDDDEDDGNDIDGDDDDEDDDGGFGDDGSEMEDDEYY